MAKKELKDYIIDQIENLKIDDIIVVDTSKTSSMADWVIIGSGRSGKHVESSMEALKSNLKNDEIYSGGMISGTANDGWIIYDLGNIIVHFFVPAVRDIYKLEELFNPKSKVLISDEKKSTIKPSVKKVDKDKKDKKTIVKKSTAKPTAKTTIKKTTTTVKKPAVKKPAVKKSVEKTNK